MGGELSPEEIEKQRKKPAIPENYYNYIETFLPLETKYKFPMPTLNVETYKIETKIMTADKGLPQYKEICIIYPIELLNNNKKYPLVFHCNGTGITCFKTINKLKHLASYGFIVVGNDDEWTWKGLSSFETLDYIFNLEKFKNKIDYENIGISGHSQGGAGCINAVSYYHDNPNSNFNSKLFKTCYSESAPSQIVGDKFQWKFKFENIKCSFFYVATTGFVDDKGIIPLEEMKKNFEKLDKNIIAIMARRKKANHQDVYADAYMTAWFLFQLKNDEEAKKVFVGENAEIVLNKENWQDVKRQNL